MSRKQCKMYQRIVIFLGFVVTGIKTVVILQEYPTTIDFLNGEHHKWQSDSFESKNSQFISFQHNKDNSELERRSDIHNSPTIKFKEVSDSTKFHLILKRHRRNAKLIDPCDKETKLTIIKDLKHRARNLYVKGRKNEAIIVYDQLIKILQDFRGENHDETLTAMDWKANILEEVGRKDEALEVYNVVLEKRRQMFGNDNEKTQLTMQNRAHTMQQMGLKTEARDAYNELIPIRSRTFGKQHPKTLQALYNLAYTLGTLDKREDALDIYDKIIPLQISSLGKNHAETLDSMQNRAYTLKKLGKKKEAVKARKLVTELRQEQTTTPTSISVVDDIARTPARNPRLLGSYESVYKKRPDKLTNFNFDLKNFTPKQEQLNSESFQSMQKDANELETMGNLTQAIQVYAQLVVNKEHVFGKDDPATLRSLHDLAYTLGSLQLSMASLKLYDKLVDSRKRVLGIHDATTLQSMSERAFEVFRNNEWPAALTAYEEVIDNNYCTTKEDRVITFIAMHNKATVVNIIGKKEEAFQLFERVIEEEKKELGMDNVITLQSMHNMADAMLNDYVSNKLEDALDLLDTVIEKRKQLLGDTDPDTLCSMFLRARIFHRQGKHSAALDINDEILNLSQNVLKDTDYLVMAVRQDRVEILLEFERDEEALISLNKIIDLKSKIFGEYYSSTLHSLCRKASILAKLGNTLEARDVYQETIKKMKIVFNETNSILRKCRADMERDILE